MRPLRLGLIGCGRVVTGRHLPALARLGEWTVAAVHDADPARMRAVAGRCPGARCHDDPADVLADVDAVAVCTPVTHHERPASAVLDAGLPLLLEKPLAFDLPTGERLARRAATAPSAPLLGLNLRHHPGLTTMRRWITDGAIGDLELVRTVFTSAIRSRGQCAGWRHRRADGGGVWIETAPHQFDLWHFLTGREIREVCAASVSDGDFDDHRAVVHGRLDGDAFAASQFAQSTVDSFLVEAWGTTGSLRLDIYSGAGLRVRRVGRGRPARIVETLGNHARALTSLAPGDRIAASFMRQWRHFAAVVRGRCQPSPTFDDGLRALRCVLAATASADAGSVCRLDAAPPEPAPSDRRIGAVHEA